MYKEVCYVFTEQELIKLATEKIKKRVPEYKYSYGGNLQPIVYNEPKDNSMVVKIRFEIN